jgi:hypothetical protein
MPQIYKYVQKYGGEIFSETGSHKIGKWAGDKIKTDFRK